MFMTVNSRMASAVHIMTFVAYAGDGGTTSEAIAKSLQTNPKDEWLAFQEKAFAMLDKGKTGKVDAKQFISADGGDIVSIATGGYARGLRTKAMMHKIDTDGDGTVSHDEYIAYQTKVFAMMDTSTTHKGMLGKEEIMFATGGNNRR